eukprot:SAG31_NODE_20950_length_561_cov_0.987013_1_plen_156_part_00
MASRLLCAVLWCLLCLRQMRRTHVGRSHGWIEALGLLSLGSAVVQICGRCCCLRCWRRRRRWQRRWKYWTGPAVSLVGYSACESGSFPARFLKIKRSRSLAIVAWARVQRVHYPGLQSPVRSGAPRLVRSLSPVQFPAVGTLVVISSSWATRTEK